MRLIHTRRAGRADSQNELSGPGNAVTCASDHRGAAGAAGAPRPRARRWRFLGRRCASRAVVPAAGAVPPAAAAPPRPRPPPAGAAPPAAGAAQLPAPHHQRAVRHLLPRHRDRAPAAALRHRHRSGRGGSRRTPTAGGVAAAGASGSARDRVHGRQPARAWTERRDPEVALAVYGDPPVDCGQSAYLKSFHPTTRPACRLNRTRERPAPTRSTPSSWRPSPSRCCPWSPRRGGPPDVIVGVDRDAADRSERPRHRQRLWPQRRDAIGRRARRRRGLRRERRLRRKATREARPVRNQ